MNEVIYLKLVNGDELFAKLMGQENNQLLLDDVMVMETVATPEDTVKYMFMSRYTSYNAMHSLQLDLNKVIFFGAVQDTVKNHYYKSLEFASKLSDERLMASIAEASHYLTLVLNKELQKNRPVKMMTDSLEEFDAPVSPTKH